MYKFQIFKDKSGQYRVRYMYNDEIMFTSEGYTSKQSAQNLIESVKSPPYSASTEDTTES